MNEIVNTSGSVVVLDLEEAITNWLEYGMHLGITHNYAVALAPACVKALDEVNNYRLDTLIELPKGVTITWDTGETTNLCPAYAIVYRFQLTDWLKKGWKMPEIEE